MSYSLESKKIAIVVSRWNELITKQLLEGAIDETEQDGKFTVEVHKVSGSWEIPVVIKHLIGGNSSVAGIVALGCILIGETQHGILLSKDVSHGLMKLQVETGCPISWGILTPDNPQQALDRSGLKMGNKGREAAKALIETIKVISEIHKS